MDVSIVVAELRPVIGSCQFFIKMNKDVEVSNVVAVLNKVYIKGSNNEDIAVLNIDKTIIACDSLSGLRVSDRSIQFRARIEPNKIYGSFKNEILFKEKNSSPQSDYYRPDFKENEEVIIFCRQCSTAFNHDPFKFRRILPLPTSFDTSDFFCHNNLSNKDITLKPEDCLYGLYYVQINVHHLADSSSDKVVFCRHCQAWLGVRERDSLMVWNSSVKFKDSNQHEDSTGLHDFISVMKHVIRKEIAVSKVILYARLSNNETHHLLIWVLEKNLSLLTNRDKNLADILLKEQKVFKVLYLYETEESDTLKKWENDMNTTQIQISKQMVEEGLNHLKHMSQNIPLDFKEADRKSVV